MADQEWREWMREDREWKMKVMEELVRMRKVMEKVVGCEAVDVVEVLEDKGRDREEISLGEKEVVVQKRGELEGKGKSVESSPSKGGEAKASELEMGEAEGGKTEDTAKKGERKETEEKVEENYKDEVVGAEGPVMETTREKEQGGEAGASGGEGEEVEKSEIREGDKGKKVEVQGKGVSWADEMEEETRKVKEEEARGRRVVMKGFVGNSWEVRVEVRKCLEKFLGGKVEVERITDLRGEKKERLLLVQLKDKSDRDWLVENAGMLETLDGIAVEEDLSYEERRTRWMVKRRAWEERRAGRKVVEDKGRVQVDGIWWKWESVEGAWAKEGGQGAGDEAEVAGVEEKQARELEGRSSGTQDRKETEGEEEGKGVEQSESVGGEIAGGSSVVGKGAVG